MTDNIDNENEFYCLVAGDASTDYEELMSSSLQRHIESAISYYELLTGKKIPIEELAGVRERENTHSGKGAQQPVIAPDTDREPFIAFLYRSTDRPKKGANARATQNNVESLRASVLVNGPEDWPEVRTQDRNSIFKTLLSISTIQSQSHAILIQMGMIPCTSSNEIRRTTPSQIAPSRSTQNRLARLGELQDLGASSVFESSGSRGSARKEQRNVGMTTDSIRLTMDSINGQDTSDNRILDINSMMVAMDDYILKVKNGNMGVPINLYLKSVTRNELATMWFRKYYPSFL